MSTTWNVTTKATAGIMTPDSPYPWGKHKGAPIRHVPPDYLRWALNNADSMSPELRVAIEQVLGILPAEGAPEVSPNQGMANLKAAWEAACRKVKEQQQELKDLKARLAVPTAMKLTDGDRFRTIVKQWYRAMSLVYHPDRGGTRESQAILNACYSDLIRRLEGDEP